MFTGLIQALGTVYPKGNDQFEVNPVSGQPELILQDLAIGDSVAVDGVCLTVTELKSQGFMATASPETLSRTTLGHGLERMFNLESSLRAGNKLGGHFVTGHVDGIGCLESSTPTASSWEMRFAGSGPGKTLWQQQIAPYLVPKGSIAINGISLTIANCDPSGTWFEVAVIPHTYAATNLRDLKPGSWVNLEADILGKYVAKFVQSRLNGNRDLGVEWAGMTTVSGLEDITPEFLAEHGFG
ncbi:MAG: riboflavin synthase [Oscillatoriales cyanobacterium RM2_1_1]|nr:riboflavin synthase [Oscillatoriales cyanobacterium SM2_3_0]NJO47734.1 riboflavin synthase [Oscillatoriales cyanobacterium RM2_1_1]